MPRIHHGLAAPTRRCSTPAPRRRALRPFMLGLVAACCTLVAHGFEVDTGDSALKLRWDNTLKYSAAARLKNADARLLGNPNNDDGDRNFGKGLISNRVDLLSELDATINRSYGLRLSAAAFYDSVYNRHNDNPGFAGGAFPNTTGAADVFTAETRRVHGRKAEVLDAFVFGKADLGDSLSVSGRLGRHAILWGESLFLGANAIAGGQMPVDVVKLMSVPGTQFKEAIRPVPQVSGQLQLSASVSLAAYYQLRWERSVVPAVGSYFSNVDVAVDGAQQLLLGGPVAPRSADIRPKDSGQGGLQLRWRVADTDLGFYAIRFHNKTPQVVPTVGFLVPPPTPVVGPLAFQQVYHSGIQAYGFSASHTLGDYNVAMEASTRRNQDLASTQGADASALGGPGLGGDNPGYAVGNTAHFNLSTLATLPGWALWNEASLMGEVAWNRVLSITKGATAVDPRATRDAWALKVQLEPTYRQVLAGLDIGVPVGLGWAPRGSRSMALGPSAVPADGNGELNIGLNGSYLDAWRFSLSWTHYFGSVNTFQVLPSNAYSYQQSLKDRDFLALSLRRTF